MPASWKDYGQEYEQLLLRVHAGLSDKTEYAVQFSEARVAHRVQARFRAYVRALRDSADRPDLTVLCADLSTRLASSALVFYKKEDSEDAVAIREALGLSREFAETSQPGLVAPSNPHMDKLQSIRQRSVVAKKKPQP